MKIDKRSARHWLALVRFGINSIIAASVRPFVRNEGAPVVVLYGHRLSGNLLAIFEARAQSGSRMTFLTMDPGYARELRAQGFPVCIATSWQCIGLLARASVFISDHGLHSLGWWPGRTSARFVDVWHGIPFKGFGPEDFRLQHRYDEVWVASPLMRDIYIQQLGFDPSRVVVTGYARTDRLAEPAQDRAAVMGRLGLEHVHGNRIVLFAPTWQQDDKGRSLFPFGLSEGEFLRGLADLCAQCGATLLIRQHLNATTGVRGESPVDARIVSVPFSEFPDTESLLAITDVLVCDWSSIAFDFLVRSRPTVFLDVQAPFAKGFTLGPEYRFGALAQDMDALLAQVSKGLREPDEFLREHGEHMCQISARVYGGFADGCASQRCIRRLEGLHQRRSSS